MPPKKRRGQQSCKAQLLFHQQPLEGPKHHCGSALQGLTHTRQVPRKPIGAIASWVSPQFDTTIESLFPAHRKHHQDRARLSSRKSTCKFPHLIFENPQFSSRPETPEIPLVKEYSSQPKKDISRQLVPMFSPQTCGELSAHALQSSPCMFAALDIQTPGPSVREDPSPPEQRENHLPVCVHTDCTPHSPEPGPVLVKDTPEEKYGIKVTWRRRRHLFAYLRERGKLCRSQFLVNS